MNPEKNQTWLPVALIAGALIGWGVVLAVGAFWAQAGESGQGDPRKLLVVAATTGGFLLLWGFVLLISRAKLRRRRQSDSADSGDISGDPGSSGS